MNTPTRSRNPYNTLLVIFASFYSSILFFKRPLWRCSYTVLVLSLAFAPYIKYIKIRVDNFPILMKIYCENNVVQVFELIFCDSEI